MRARWHDLETCDRSWPCISEQAQGTWSAYQYRIPQVDAVCGCLFGDQTLVLPRLFREWQRFCPPRPYRTSAHMRESYPIFRTDITGRLRVIRSLVLILVAYTLSFSVLCKPAVVGPRGSRTNVSLAWCSIDVSAARSFANIHRRKSV
jgi:hypothetical protein